jgi:hypothetical protein
VNTVAGMSIWCAAGSIVLFFARKPCDCNLHYGFIASLCYDGMHFGEFMFILLHLL